MAQSRTDLNYNLNHQDNELYVIKSQMLLVAVLIMYYIDRKFRNGINEVALRVFCKGVTRFSDKRRLFVRFYNNPLSMASGFILLGFQNATFTSMYS